MKKATLQVAFPPLHDELADANSTEHPMWVLR